MTWQCFYMQFSLIVVMQEKVCEDSIARTMRLRPSCRCVCGTIQSIPATQWQRAVVEAHHESNKLYFELHVVFF